MFPKYFEACTILTAKPNKIIQEKKPSDQYIPNDISAKVQKKKKQPKEQQYIKIINQDQVAFIPRMQTVGMFF